MSRKKSLQTIQTLAESNETLRLKVLTDKRQELATEEQRLVQLQQYCNEYQAMTSKTDQGIGIHFIRGRRGFVEKLGTAIDTQRKTVEQAREQLDVHTAHWRDARTKALSLRKFTDRLAVEEQQRLARKEQSELDEVGRLVVTR
ncbi:MAG: flagellar export protein FliJ [Gammaproteobacteria bacterium]|nr:flagellar export protein FliJ [Gammaproteobacteria bacterium]